MIKIRLKRQETSACSGMGGSLIVGKLLFIQLSLIHWLVHSSHVVRMFVCSCLGITEGQVGPAFCIHRATRDTKHLCKSSTRGRNPLSQHISRLARAKSVGTK